MSVKGRGERKPTAEKISKIFVKPLDKRAKACYNIDTVRGERPTDEYAPTA